MSGNRLINISTTKVKPWPCTIEENEHFGVQFKQIDTIQMKK